MPDAITGPLADLFGDSISAQPGSLDAFGDWIPSGAAIAVSCRISFDSRLVRDGRGREVVSSARATCAGVYDLSVEAHRFTLPASFEPRDDITAIAVSTISDENGPHHEVIVLP